MSASRPLLILGSAGQLGSDILVAAQRLGIDHIGLNHTDVDVTVAADVAVAFHRIKPAVVINCTSLTNVEGCEENPTEAYRVNAVGALVMARAARDVAARFIHLSTDYVFDGQREPGTKYSEGDAMRPLNVYGASKAAAEQLVWQTLDDHLIVRVSSLFGVVGARGKGGNFIETVLRKAREGGPLKVVNDQWMTPTYSADASEAILRLAMSETTGVVHVTNPDACTWYALATEAVSLVGLATPVEPVPATAFPSKVRRPRNSALATLKLEQLIGSSLPPWRQALRVYLTSKGHLDKSPANTLTQR